MSIATYLEPGSIDFDLVIFDEASQVKVADGLGAILRGKQVIVVGDTKQMPPTNFFGRQFTLDDEEAELSLTADIESILGMFLASGTPERMLKWHYRSRHESLIAVSNQEFYDNKLMIFHLRELIQMRRGLA
ncbi:DNA helicase related protein [Vibrio ishigakensis]|uniref:DNA helicase related protein n=1 Tax=Vibrio ishigakensis TaxID=1481914 RepID=A0A0B8QCI3_9VIBR|nr:DNA helicase related protein [Vibrio ishigakensis]